VWGAVREAGYADTRYRQIAEVVESALDVNDFATIFRDLRAIHRLHTTIGSASRAAQGSNSSRRIEAWIQEDTLKYYVPTLAHETKMIEYAPTFEIIAKRLNEMLWTKVKRKVVVMSATMTNAHNPADPFNLFRMQMGIVEAATLRVDQVFDRNLVRIVAPQMPTWSDASNKRPMGGAPFTKDDFRRLQAREIKKLIDAVRPTKKSILVLGPSANQEANDLYELLRGEHSMEHIHSRKNYRVYKTFCNAANGGPAVVYGGKTEAIGLNLPGRLRGAVITRPPNGRHLDTRIKYHKERGLHDSYHNLLYFGRDQLALQAAGRIQRSATDRGILLILGEPLGRKDRFLHISEVIHRTWGQGAANKPIRALDWDTLDLETFLV